MLVDLVADRRQGYLSLLPELTAGGAPPVIESGTTPAPPAPEPGQVNETGEGRVSESVPLGR